eukprot:scaffold229512_cov16-Prasinocladus_malaysianus.AAC.1
MSQTRRLTHASNYRWQVQQSSAVRISESGPRIFGSQQKVKTPNVHLGSDAYWSYGPTTCIWHAKGLKASSVRCIAYIKGLYLARSGTLVRYHNCNHYEYRH